MRWRIVLILSIMPLGFSPRDAVCADQGIRSSSDTGLDLHIAINSRNFCSADDEVYTEVFNLILRYTNKGKSTVTVFIGTDIAEATQVALTIQGMKTGKYESEIGGALLPMDGGRYMFGSDPDTERSVSLVPGQSVVVKHPVGVVVSKSESAKVPGTITSGKHLLQVLMMIKVSDGSKNKVTADSMNQHPEFRWVKVPSQPVEFAVPVNPDLTDCSN
jgi:hypothetical protein